MTIRGHVGGNEHPLGKLVVLEILEEHGGVLNLSKAVLIGDNGVEEDFGAARG